MPASAPEVATNQPCVNNRGVYDGWIYYFSPAGNPIPPINVDLGPTLPATGVPEELISWTLQKSDVQRQAELRPKLDRAHVAAVTVTRLCFSANHIGLPESPAYNSRRVELVRNLFVVVDGAQPVEVHPSQTVTSDDNGFGGLKVQERGMTIMENAIFLPVFSTRANPVPIRGGIQLSVPRRHNRQTYGVLRGFEDTVEASKVTS